MIEENAVDCGLFCVLHLKFQLEFEVVVPLIARHLRSTVLRKM